MYKDWSGPCALPAPILLPRLGAVLSTGALPWGKASANRAPRQTSSQPWGKVVLTIMKKKLLLVAIF